MTAVRPIAFYLPQFHPIPENDKWWGTGFTEWTNVAKARPLFKGHYQPHLPADLGFYDLRLPETRIQQAEMAKDHGVYGFCYYHYWHHGNRLLNRPFDEVLASGQPDFPFCLCWANHNWTRRWDGFNNDVLIKQEYSPEDDLRHIQWLAKVFADERYIRVDGKPLFLVYWPSELPDSRRTIEIWRTEAQKLGVGEIYVCAVEGVSAVAPDALPAGFDAAVEFQPRWVDAPSNLQRTRYWEWARKLGLASVAFRDHHVWDYREFSEHMTTIAEPNYLRFRCVTPSWDNSPRHKRRAFILNNSTPEYYEKWLSFATQRTLANPKLEGVLFINGWNEWAEGDHLEPCQKWGRAYLDATRHVIEVCNSVGQR